MTELAVIHFKYVASKYISGKLASDRNTTKLFSLNRKERILAF
jgi:hypothetical protein